MQNQSFTIKTEQFEGPLDLLLSLIEKRKLLINEFSLAKITDEYISYIQGNPEYTMANRVDFIVIASTLLLIKSRSLLPEIDLTTEEEEDIDSLQNRLRLYQKIKELSEGIKNMFCKTPLYFANQNREIKIIFTPSKKIDRNNMFSLLNEMLSKLPKKEEPQKASIKKTISIEEMINNLTERIKKSVKMSFREFTGNSNKKTREERVNVIVGFLALLEMVKQGIINVNQEKTFEDILIESEEISIPRYN